MVWLLRITVSRKSPLMLLSARDAAVKATVAGSVRPTAATWPVWSIVALLLSAVDQLISAGANPSNLRLGEPEPEAT